MTEAFDTHILDNGLVILGEPMEGVQSAAFAFIVPAGAARLTRAYCGAANVILDWIFRGAGTRDSRQFNDALDILGLHRAGSIGGANLTLGAALEAGNLSAALDLYADVLVKPHLAADQFELARQLTQEEILSLEDDPRQKAMLLLREQFYPAPLGIPTAGDLDVVRSLQADQVSDLAAKHLNMGATIMTVAGKYDFAALCAQIQKRFGDVAGQPLEPFSLGDTGERTLHVAHEGAQVHIGLMAPTVTIADPDYYAARVAVSILSGGMSARLFTEVREKRGLCYAIDARYHGMKEVAGVACYAGTTPDKAQETRDVIQAEFQNLSQGITEDELGRAKVGLKAALVMQSESTSSRVGALGGDYYLLGRVRPLEEIKQGVEAVTVESVTDFLTRHPIQNFTQVTIGPVTVENRA